MQGKIYIAFPSCMLAGHLFGLATRLRFKNSRPFSWNRVELKHRLACQVWENDDLSLALQLELHAKRVDLCQLNQSYFERQFMASNLIKNTGVFNCFSPICIYKCPKNFKCELMKVINHQFLSHGRNLQCSK